MTKCCTGLQRGVPLELAQGVCPSHAQDQLLMLPGHYTSSQAARRCRSLGGRQPHPSENRLPGVASTVGVAESFFHSLSSIIALFL